MIVLTVDEIVVTLRCTQKELIKLGLDIASGLAKYEDILDWIVRHRNPPLKPLEQNS